MVWSFKAWVAPGRIKIFGAPIDKHIEQLLTAKTRKLPFALVAVILFLNTVVNNSSFLSAVEYPSFRLSEVAT